MIRPVMIFGAEVWLVAQTERRGTLRKTAMVWARAVMRIR